MTTNIERDTYYYALADRDHESSWVHASSRHVLSFLTQSGSDMFELGCGTATIVPYLPQAWHYTGVDISDYAIERARSNFPNSTFVRASASRLPFADESFDAILSIHALEHFENPRAALGEVIRILRPGGRGVLIGPNLDLPLSLPNAVRHWNAPRRTWLRLQRVTDYVLRVFDILKFRTVHPNYTEETGRYELPDDDLRYLISADEVARYLGFRGMKLEQVSSSSSGQEIPTVKRCMRIIPGLKRYGEGMRIFFQKPPLQ